VRATVPTPGVQSDPEAATLGTVLYADGGKPRVSETVWVALVHEIAAGNQQALRDLYGRMHRIVFTLIMRIVQDNETAEELTLDVFHDVWRRARSFDEAAGSVVGWVMNQARSRAIDRTRFDQRTKRVNPYPDSPPVAALTVTADAEIDGRQREQRLRAALTHLTADEREAIELAFFSECTYAEVAARLSEPAGTVKTRIRSGLRKLRQTLKYEVGGE
jgi:RNA polymerase sigma-70 factor, ECF subfamily